MINLMQLSYARMWEQELSIYKMQGNSHCGMFQFMSNVDGQRLLCIASNGGGWDHISVSRADRCPQWEEMEQIAKIFFHADEFAFQLHVPPVAHINVHLYCLHWWRPHNVPIPIPPKEMVG